MAGGGATSSPGRDIALPSKPGAGPRARSGKDAERLVLQARRDLENARKNIGIGAYEVSAFLAHQAVEKLLKGAWMSSATRPKSSNASDRNSAW